VKNKRLISGVVKVAIFILVFILYFFLYFLPSVKQINNYKRETRTYGLKVRDYQKNEVRFAKLTNREKRAFSRLNAELMKKLSVSAAKGLEQVSGNLYKETISFIREEARKCRINVLNIGLEKELKSVGDLRAFACLRIEELNKAYRKINHHQELNTTITSIDTLYSTRGLIYFFPLFVKFQTDFNNALDFINHLGWLKQYAKIDKIFIGEGGSQPHFFLSIYLYLGDYSKKKFKNFLPEDILNSFPVDRNSEILLREIYLGNESRNQGFPVLN